MENTCSICPRRCGKRRAGDRGEGFCAMGTLPKLARAGVHMWEEPVISGTRGSGTVFFSGCSLRCVYCQNREISAGGFGKTVSVRRLADIFRELEDKGVHNINLVNPTHFAGAILDALELYSPGLPIVYNTGGYDSVGTLRLFEGAVSIYLPDMKYSSGSLAAKYSSAPDYPETAAAAIAEMFRQTGPYALGDDGIMKSGVIVRHLVLPENLENTFGVIGWMEDTFSPGDVLFSLMSQFTPVPGTEAFPELGRRLTPEEYGAAVGRLEESSIEDGFYQELSSAKEEYIPPFDLSGV